jgi:hypothetical protein
MARVITTETPQQDVRRFLWHWASHAFVEDRLREQQPSLSTERRRTKARQVSRLVHQGLEFLENADGSRINTKPLTLFYGAENLAKASCICRDLNLGADDIRFHGLSGEREVRRNSMKNLSCRVREPSNDVWSNFFRLFNSDRYQLQVSEGIDSSIHDHVVHHPSAPLVPPAEIKLGHLLLHLPELVDDIRLASWGPSYMVRADGFRFTTKQGTPPKHSGSFKLRHDHDPATKAMIERRSHLLRHFEKKRERLDVFVYEAEPTPSSISYPTIRPDMVGDPYMDLGGGRREFGEPVIYLAALFILSDVVRYQAEHWLRLLEDHPAEGILVERFLDIAARKFPNLILNELHQQIIKFVFAR